MKLLFIMLLSIFRNINTLSLYMKIQKASKSKRCNMIPLYKPRTNNQKKYNKELENGNSKVVIGLGPAGTGKTLFACCYAIQELERGNIEKIILTRPIVPVEEDLGYLPGKLINKMEPWTRPLFDILREYHSNQQINTMLQSGIIEIAPLAYMRGRTFKRSIVIADEMQNSSPNQMLMIATRLGDYSKLIITGDLEQSDRMEDNGLKDLVKKIDAYPYNCSEIASVFFQQEDIQRSPIVSKILNIYEYNTRRLPLPSTDYIQETHEEQRNREREQKEDTNLNNYDKIRQVNDDAAIIPLYDMEKLDNVKNRRRKRKND